MQEEIHMSENDGAVAKIPGFIAGTWEIDAIHSEVSFVVRHLVVSKVRGQCRLGSLVGERHD